MAKNGDCWSCGQPLEAVDYQREARCPTCQKATHVCRNCRFYRPGVSNDCVEPIAGYVSDKIRANFCDYFEPVAHASEDKQGPSPEKLLGAAEDLFKP